jgi:hypothetical protein|nr:MAG TPA: hypothetical protein [Caudoviricetes sp.]
MDYDEITAVDIVDGLIPKNTTTDDAKPKLVIVKHASIYTESQRGGPIYKGHNEGEVTLRVEFFKSASASDQAWFLQKVEEAVVDIIHDHSRMETWAR